jgi:hypothetical protein
MLSRFGRGLRHDRHKLEPKSPEKTLYRAADRGGLENRRVDSSSDSLNLLLVVRA